MKDNYTYGVVSADRKWMSALRPSPELAIKSFTFSREKRGEEADWELLQTERGYRLVCYYLTPVSTLENGDWVDMEPDSEAVT